MRHEVPERAGDVLGISNVRPDPETSRNVRKGGHPAGIDVRKRATGIGDVPQRSGATGVDMGGGGEGTLISDQPSPRPVGEDPDND